MSEKLSPLVVTPTPFQGESLMGFLLRTSQMNGYSTPGDILRYAGLTENQVRSARIPLDKVTRILAQNVSKLESFAYTDEGGNRYGKHFRLVGHDIHTIYLQIKGASVCPECVEELGYIDAFWDLRYAVACPHHRHVPLKQCPSCGKRLTWSRPDMLQCRCGHDLNQQTDGCLADDTVIALLEVLWRKLHHKPLTSDRIITVGFPLKEFESMTLQTFLGVIERFGRVAQKNNPSMNINEMITMVIAANALADWPNGIYKYLEEIGGGQHFKSDKSAFGLRKQFTTFYSSMFKSGLPVEKMGFMRKAFLSFGTDHWKRASLDTKLLRGAEGENISVGGISDVAEIIGVQPITVRQMVKAGLIKPVRLENGKTARLLFDLSQEMPRRIDEGVSYTKREAAKIMEMPVSVLMSLRRMGVFCVRRLGTKVASFHEYDVADYKRALLQVVPDVSQPDGNRESTVSLTDVMRMKVGSSDRKANVIEAVLKGNLHIFGRIGDGVLDIALNRNAVMNMLHDDRASETGGRLVSEVVKLLRCDSVVVTSLVDNGYLERVPDLNCIRITEDSLLNFSGIYVSCAWLANHLKASSRAIARRFEAEGKTLLYAERGCGRPPQPFVRREDAITLGLLKEPVTEGA